MPWILARHNERFPRAARQMAAVFDLGCAVYFAVPTAPPWWASEQGHTGDDEVRRIMVEVGERTWKGAWPKMYDSLGGNPWAAMPSLHFATSVMAAILLSESGRAEGLAGWTYAADARLRARLSGRALRHRPDRRRGAGRGRPLRRAAGRAGGQRGEQGTAESRANSRAARTTCVGFIFRAGNEEPRTREPEEKSAAGLRRRRTPFLRDPKKLLQTGVVVLLLIVAIYVLLPEGDRPRARSTRSRKGDPWWIAAALGFNVLAFAAYVALFRGVVGEWVVHLDWRESYQITMAGLAATRLFSAGGAGGIVLTYWALRKAGMERRESACRMVAFLVVLYAVYLLALVVFGVLLRTGVLSGEAPAGLTIVPAAVAGVVIVIVLALTLLPDDFERRIGSRQEAHWTARFARRPRDRAGDPRRGHPHRGLLRSPPLARRPGGDRRGRLLGGQHRHPLGQLPRLRRPRAARRRRPGLLPRHGRQPVPFAPGGSAPSTPA